VIDCVYTDKFCWSEVRTDAITERRSAPLRFAGLVVVPGFCRLPESTLSVVVRRFHLGDKDEGEEIVDVPMPEGK